MVIAFCFMLLQDIQLPSGHQTGRGVDFASKHRRLIAWPHAATSSTGLLNPVRTPAPMLPELVPFSDRTSWSLFLLPRLVHLPGPFLLVALLVPPQSRPYSILSYWFSRAHGATSRMGPLTQMLVTRLLTPVRTAGPPSLVPRSGLPLLAPFF